MSSGAVNAALEQGIQLGEARQLSLKLGRCGDGDDAGSDDGWEVEQDGLCARRRRDAGGGGDDVSG